MLGAFSYSDVPMTRLRYRTVFDVKGEGPDFVTRNGRDRDAGKLHRRAGRGLCQRNSVISFRTYRDRLEGARRSVLMGTGRPSTTSKESDLGILQLACTTGQACRRPGFVAVRGRTHGRHAA